MRFPVQDIIDIGMNNTQEREIHKALCALADDLNATLLYYEVTLEHFDRGDYLRFEKRSPGAIEAIEDYRKIAEDMAS